MIHKNHNHYFGLIAEIIVMIRYILSFHSLIKHRYKSKLGEIDLIFSKGKKIIFVEVKARSSKIDNQNYVSESQKKRLSISADNYLAKNHHFQEAEFHLVIVKSIFNILVFKEWIKN